MNGGPRGHYRFALKGNQPVLQQDLWAIWETEPAGEPQAVQLNQHGDRVEQRHLWASDRLVGYSDWRPHLAQVCRLERIIRTKGKTRRALAYAVTSLAPQDASPQRLLAWWWGHWGIANRVHWVRDVTFDQDADQDRSQVRTGAAPQIMAGLCNLSVSLIRLAGPTNIAAALRRHAAQPSLPLNLIGASLR